MASWNRPFEPLGVAVADATFCNGKRYIVTQVSLLYRSPSFVLLASIAGEAIDIKDRAGCANKRPYYSLVTFSLWSDPNVKWHKNNTTIWGRSAAERGPKCALLKKRLPGAEGTFTDVGGGSRVPSVGFPVFPCRNTVPVYECGGSSGLRLCACARGSVSVSRPGLCLLSEEMLGCESVNSNLRIRNTRY